MKKILSSIVVAGLLVTSSFAADNKTENVKHNAVIKAENKAGNKLVAQALKALKYTEDANIYLSHKSTNLAIESLKKAIGELTIVLNSPNAPYLLPVNVNIKAYEYAGNIKNISTQIKLAKKAVENNNLPLAREILNSLRSEIDISTVNIPLATYPSAIKLAVKYLNEHKIKEAQDVINMALNTLVTTNTVIPIPLLKANDLIVAASKAVKKDKKQTLKYLEEAKKQLKLAELLGYSSKSNTTYKMLKDSINKIENKINNHKNTDSFFANLKNKIEEFKEKAISVISK